MTIRPSMKTMIAALAVCGLILLSTSSAQSRQGPENADEDSCYNTADRCVSARSSRDGNRIELTVTNNCRGRIYIKYCLERTGGQSPKCGSRGLEVGESTEYGAYTVSGTGRYTVDWVGVLEDDKDWRCSGKLPYWNDPPNFD